MSREIKQHLAENVSIIEAKYIGRGVSGLRFEAKDGREIRRVISQDQSAIVEDTWWTLIRSGSEWSVAGTAGSAPTSEVPGGSV